MTITLWIIGQSTTTQSPIIYMYTYPMLINFIFGAILAYFAMTLDKQEFNMSSKMLRVVGIALICASLILIILRPLYWPDAPRWVSLGIVGAVLVAGALILEYSGWSIRSKLIDKLTELTYGVYLLHFFWNVILEKIAPEIGKSATVALMILTPVPVLCLAYLGNRFVEVPVTRMLLRHTPWPRHKTD